ncbi:dihydrofolate reductase [Pseudocyphellaria aurata]|nr:dihydrofolate reductase [Pseudocyphellaria aurata]
MSPTSDTPSLTSDQYISRSSSQSSFFEPLPTPMPPRTPLPSLTLIVATTPSLGMGYFGSFPWPTLNSDLAFFARVTKRLRPPSQRKNDNDKVSNHNHHTSPSQPTATASINALIMGRKTWASIPASRRPLRDRVNVIITRQKAAIAAELESAGLGKAVGADGKQHVIVAGSMEEGLRLLVQEYPPGPPPPHQKTSGGEGDGGGGNQEEPGEFAGKPKSPSLGRVFVIGGAQIYASALELDNCERLLWTRLQREWKCDVWFPSGVFVDDDVRAADTNEPMEGAGETKREGWGRRPDEELNDWCGESIAGEKEEPGEEGFNYRVEMWERKRVSIGDGGC